MLRRTKSLLGSLSSAARLRVLDPATPRERELIAELRARLRALPERDVSGGSEAANTWARVLNHFRHLVATQDPRAFLTWGHLQTMFVGDADYVRPELEHLRRQPDWETRWRKAVEESPVGKPARYPAWPESSGNLLHHAYHVCRFEEATGLRAEELELVIEFGGGYGSMCRLFHALGFRGRYVIFDFAEFSCLQEYFLKSLGLPVRQAASMKDGAPGVATLSDVDELGATVEALAPRARASLLLATWSLSETPVEFRQRVLSTAAHFDAFLLAYQERFGEADNRAFFDDWKQTRTDVRWAGEHLEHIPGNFYLFGRRREPRASTR
ncbi:MAG TPA: hypothetical protein VGV38_21135 [Pyrinomonadaceae bacterium]|nr:hypothetical protein [Pyrinomonadaceae bacterium]